MKSANDDLIERTKRFALRVIRLFVSLPKTGEAQVLGKQLLRSGTSVGAPIARPIGHAVGPSLLPNAATRSAKSKNPPIGSNSWKKAASSQPQNSKTSAPKQTNSQPSSSLS
jgi:hypothetical protein